MNEASARAVFGHVSRHDMFAFIEWCEMNKPGDLDIYRPNYDAVMAVLNKVKKEIYAE